MIKKAAAGSGQPTVYVVDDDESVRRAICVLLDSVDYASSAFATPKQFLQQFDAQKAGCLVLDIRMPEMSGLEVQSKLNERGAILPVIFITGHGDVPIAVQAMKNGAFDFIQKPFRDQELLDKINAALAQDHENREALSRKDDLRKRRESLTPRESEVMVMIVQGKANKVVALDLELSERTVEIHRARVMEKMGARSVAHLVKMALILGEIDPAHSII